MSALRWLPYLDPRFSQVHLPSVLRGRDIEKPQIMFFTVKSFLMKTFTAEITVKPDPLSPEWLLSVLSEEEEVEVDGVMCDSVGRGRDISCRGPPGNYLSGGGRL